MKSLPSSTVTARDKSAEKQPVRTIVTKLRIVKNLVVLSFGTLFSSCCYTALGFLQSTLNRKDGIGVITVSIQYGCGCISNLLIAKYFLKKFGSKSVITVTSISYVIYATANLYPTWYLLIPASVIVGLSNSLYWAAVCQYLNGLSMLYADHLEKQKGPLEDEQTVLRPNGIRRDCGEAKDSRFMNENEDHDSQSDTFVKGNYPLHSEEAEKIFNESNELNDKEYQSKEPANGIRGIETEELYYCSEPSPSNLEFLKNDHSLSSKIGPSEVLESTTSRMFGFHAFISVTSYIWGNLLSYYVIQSGSIDNNYINNSTCHCGADFCNVETACFEHNLQEPTEQMKYALLGCFIAIGILAVLNVVFFLDKLNRKEDPVFITWEVLFASLRHMKDKYEIFLAPLVLLLGLAQGFVMADFPKAYVGCAWGMHHVGLVLTCFGVCISLSCSVSGWFVKHVGRVPIFLIAEAAIVTACVLMLTWYPDAEKPAMFFVIAGLFGVNLAILWSQLRAFYGVLFKEDEEVAFGNFTILQFIGISTAFGYSNFLCTSTKIYILIVISVIGCVGYLFAERSHSLRKALRSECH